jgi:hypothetical protein
MARSIPANALTELAKTHGTEPIIILSVEWAGSSTAPQWYADRAVGSIPGKILEVGGLDNVVGISLNDTSQEIDVILDDVDGSIKALFNAHDVHKRTARVYQYFHGLDLSDKFLVFSGKISSPIVWDERDRTVKFSVVSQIEDKEIGFSPEEGQFEWLPSAMVGKPWPLIFGRVLDVPALQINEAVSGVTLCGVGVIEGLELLANTPLFANGVNYDSSTFISLALISMQISTLNCGWYCYYTWNFYGKADEILDQINELERQRFEIVSQASARVMCAEWQRNKQIQEATSQGLGCNPIRILGGEDFPQGQTLTIEINGARFTGYFNGQNFYISSRSWPEGLIAAQQQFNDNEETCPYEISSGGGVTDYDYRMNVPCRCGNQFFEDCLCRFHGFIIQTGSGRASDISEDPIPQQFWAEPGATVRIYSDEPITYIVAHLYDQWPGEVLAVKAYKEFLGERRLVDVPSDYYTVEKVAYGRLKTVQIVTDKPLSSYLDQGWTDDLYVTFESNVGPDVTDILEYIIDYYTDLSVDAESFAAVQAKLDPFPMNFPILDRRNTVEVLQEIAYQARCALWISNGTVYLKYLPEEPDSVDTITVSDIDAEQGIQVELTSTEDIVTKMRVKWRMRWSPGITDREKDKSEQQIILRHNVSRYGIQEEEVDFYAYNQPDIIYKCATFWLIRKSNTWKRIHFSTFLHKLQLETFDCVTLNFTQGYVADGAVKAIVEEATYNSDTNRIDFTCLVPVKAGQMEKYDWFWPSGLSIHLTWPPPDEIAAGDAGGDGLGADVSGMLPIGYFEDWGDDIVIVGGPNVVFRPQSDWGDRIPTDIDFSAQEVVNPSSYGEVSGVSKPRLNLKTFLAQPTNPPIPSDLTTGFVIDIRKTRITDSEEAPRQTAYLADFIYGINADNQLVLRKDLKIADEEHPDGEIFDFKWSDDYDLWAAGTAFLRDNGE